MTREQIIQLYKEKAVAEDAYEAAHDKVKRIERRLLGQCNKYSTAASLENVFEICRYAGAPFSEEMGQSTSWNPKSKFKFLAWKVSGKKAIFLRKLAKKRKIEFKIELFSSPIYYLLGYETLQRKLSEENQKNIKFQFIVKAPYFFYKNALVSTTPGEFITRCAQRQEVLKKMRKVKNVTKALDGKIKN